MNGNSGISSINASINLVGIRAEELGTRILKIDDGRTFVSVQIGDTLRLILPGFDADVVAFARALAQVLVDAAKNVEVSIAVAEAIPMVEGAAQPCA